MGFPPPWILIAGWVLKTITEVILYCGGFYQLLHKSIESVPDSNMNEGNRHTVHAFPAAGAGLTTQKVDLKPILLVSALGGLMHWLTDGGRCPVGFCQGSQALNWLQSQDAHACMAQHMATGTGAPCHLDWWRLTCQQGLGPLGQGLKAFLRTLQVIYCYLGEKIKHLPPKKRKLF